MCSYNCGQPSIAIPPMADDLPMRMCVTGNRILTKGPGDFLHAAILFWTKEAPQRGCGCDDLIAKMNQWGSACRGHLDEIADHMIEQAKERGWKLAGMPGAATVCRLMVLRAVRQAERAIASQSRGL